jgi:hypothetical protein
MECQICCERFNQTSHKNIVCNFCDYPLCRACFQKYILDLNTDPNCMNCKRVLNREFLSNSCTSVFINTVLKNHREDILFDREKALLPETQPYVVIELEKMKILKHISNINSEINILHQQIHLKQDEIAESYNLIRNIGKSPVEHKKFVRKCPVEECRGFLSTQWKCGSCETHICNKCNEPKVTEDHVCISENIASMDFINRDTKPCPSCGCMIHKINGCFAKDIEILLWNGGIKMSQDIIIGDILIGDDGTKRIVQDTVSGIDQLYKISQSNGIEYTVNSKHVLLFKIASNNNISIHKEHIIIKWFNHSEFSYHTKKFYFNNYPDKNLYKIVSDFSKNLNIPDILQITVDKYIKLPDKIKSFLLGFKNDGVNWEHREIDLDPYLLGLWLGDGNSNGSGFASNDIEITQYFIDWAGKNNLYIVHQNKFYYSINSYLNNRKPIGYETNCKECLKKECGLCSVPNNKELGNLTSRTGRSINNFRTILKKYNLLNNKHIPDDFLLNSRDNRLKLLAGIIDTDGYVCNEGKRITISQVNPVLSEQIITLARSLGFIVNYQIVKRLNVKFPNNDKLVDCKDQYHINISGIHANEIPTILLRKKCNSSKPNKDYKKSSIKVTPVDIGNYYGFLLDGNHRFILKDFTVVNNCSQIFCTECHTAWDWNRGTIETGVIHNPHYYDFLRQQNGGVAPRNHGDVPCGGLPDINMLNRKTCRFNEKYKQLMLVHRLVIHIEQVELRDYMVVPDTPELNRHLRVNYLLNHLSEQEFKRTLQQREKIREKNIDFRNIYQMFIDVTGDIFRKIVDKNLITDEYLSEQITIITNLIIYFNENIAKIGKLYKCVYPGISREYSFHHNYVTYLVRQK